MTRMFLAVLAVALVGVACDSVGVGGSRERADYELHEERARSYEWMYRKNSETVQTYRAWQARVRAEDLAPMRLPPPAKATTRSGP